MSKNKSVNVHPVRKAMITAPVTMGIVFASFSAPFVFNVDAANAGIINIENVQADELNKKLPYNDATNLKGVSYNSELGDVNRTYTTAFDQGLGTTVKEDWLGDVKTTVTSNGGAGSFGNMESNWSNDFSGGGSYTLNYDFSGLKNGYLPAGTLIYLEDLDTGTPDNGEKGTWSAPGQTEKWADYVEDMLGYYAGEDVGFAERAPLEGASQAVTYDDVAHSYTVNNTGNGDNPQTRSVFVTTKNVDKLQLDIQGPAGNGPGANYIQFGIAAPIDQPYVSYRHEYAGDPADIQYFEDNIYSVFVTNKFHKDNDAPEYESRTFFQRDFDNGKYQQIPMKNFNRSDDLTIDAIDTFISPKGSDEIFNNYDWDTKLVEGEFGKYNDASPQQYKAVTTIRNIGPSNPTHDYATTYESKPITIAPLDNDSLRKQNDMYLLDPNANPSARLFSAFVTSNTLTLPEGTFVLNEDHTVTFTPSAGFTGKVPTIKYYIDDKRQTDTYTGNTQPKVSDLDLYFTEYLSTIDVDVLPLPAPVAQEDDKTSAYNTPVTINVLDNDNAGENAKVSKVEILDKDKNPVKEFTNDNGTLVVNKDNTFTFTPKNGFTGTASFDYRLTNDFDKYSDAVLNITVEGPELPSPTAEEDVYSTSKNTTINFQPLVNDTLVDGSTWKDVTLKDSNGNAVKELVVTGGKFVVQADLSVTFTPDKDFTGSVEPVSYTATDSNDKTVDSVINITVTGGEVIPDEDENTDTPVTPAPDTDNDNSNNGGNSDNTGSNNAPGNETPTDKTGNNSANGNKADDAKSNTVDKTDSKASDTNSSAKVKTGGEVVSDNTTIGGIALAAFGVLMAAVVVLRKKIPFLNK